MTDLSGRTFENITGFQYAVWALDWHMWKMIYNMENPERGYLSAEQAVRQMEALPQGKWVKKYDVHFSFDPLINALDTYVKNYEPWTTAQCEKHWCQQVGGAQLWLPAHVINEYCRPDRSFDPTPNFLDAGLPRSMKTDEGFWFTAEYNGGKLGVKFGVARAGLRGVSWAGGRRGVSVDLRAISALSEARHEQLAELKSNLSHHVASLKVKGR